MNSDIKVLTIENSDPMFETMCSDIEQFAMTFPENMRRIENYRNDLKIRNSLAVSVYLNESKIIGFSSVLHRPLFGNGVRILNRFLKTNSFRFKTYKSQWTPETLEMINQQIQVAKKHNFDYVFASRESYRNSSILTHLFGTKLGWNCPEHKFVVCESEKDSCKQLIAWIPVSSPNAICQLQPHNG
jgi:hypothetical protein